jgi:hypothetical protein
MCRLEILESEGRGKKKDAGKCKPQKKYSTLSRNPKRSKRGTKPSRKEREKIKATPTPEHQSLEQITMLEPFCFDCPHSHYQERKKGQQALCGGDTHYGRALKIHQQK